MMALASGWALLRGLPRPLLFALAGIGVILLLWRWHGVKVDAAFVDGGRQQAATDALRFEAAGAAAAKVQAALVAGLAGQQSRISKGTDDALVARTDDLARRYDDLRLRWAAHRGHPSNGSTIAVSAAADDFDDAACPARGWVSFDIAVAAAEAADTAIAKDDAWIAWAGAQAEAWPEP